MISLHVSVGKSKQFAQNVPHALSEHAFVFTLALIALGLILSLLIFFVFATGSKQQDGSAPTEEVALREDLFQNIVKELILDEKAVQESKTLFPKDIFLP